MDEHRFGKDDCDTVGEMANVCAQIVLTSLYSVRVGRPNLLCIVNIPARAVEIGMPFLDVLVRITSQHSSYISRSKQNVHEIVTKHEGWLFSQQANQNQEQDTARRDNTTRVTSSLFSQYTPTGNLSSCFFYSGRVNFLMQLQFLAPVELFFKQLKGYSF